MGKRRSRKAPQKKAASKLPTQFDCPFCNHQSTIHVKVHYASGVGSLECRVCAVKADTRITHLSKEIDVYCEWMDSCVELNKQDDDNPLEETQDQGPKKRQRLKEEEQDNLDPAAFENDDVDSTFAKEGVIGLDHGDGLVASEEPEVLD